jgi:hypothetical protein
MSFTRYADGPGQIIIEGQQITLKFIRTSETTGKIEWNIPMPAAGCDSDSQAYDGIVLTVDNKAANYLSTSPVDGKYYTADPTADRDIHLGDRLDTALVVGAFYNDKTTTSMVLTGLKPKTPYYVSGYAVDAQARYYREGVHAYSIPKGVGELLTPDTAGYQDINIFSHGPVHPNSPTGLKPDRCYKFAIEMCCHRYDYEIPGHEALSYNDLIRAINAAFAESTCVMSGPLPPHAGEYYMDAANCSLKYWDGWKYSYSEVVCRDTDPRIPELGTYWYNPETDKLFIYETGGWVLVTNIIVHPTDPTLIVDGQIWFDGTDAWIWEGNHWCKLCVYKSDRNPLFPPVMTEGTYWFNTETDILTEWSMVQRKWLNVDAIYSYSDPNNFQTGDFWYDETNKKMMVFNAGAFTVDENVKYKEPKKDGSYPGTVKADMLWFVPSTGDFFKRNEDNTEWETLRYTSYPTDPTIRKSCNLWWDGNTKKLFVWDAVNNRWIEALHFYQQDTDPRIPPTLPDCAVWYDTKTGKIIKIMTAECEEVTPIVSKYDPTNLPVGTIWRWKDSWKRWDGEKWEPIKPIYSKTNPYEFEDDQFWYDSKNKKLYQLIGGIWVSTPFSDTDLTPKKGEQWLNTIEDQLLEWDGVTWIPSHPFAYAEWRARTCKEDRDGIRFYTRKTGCTDCRYEFKIIIESDNLFTHLQPSVMYNDPVAPNDGLRKGPTYEQLGIGTDGSPVERRELADKLMVMLGAPSIQVELTKEQLDVAIDNALQVLRKYSSYAVTPALFFFDILPGQQVYRMTNECVGFHKIVDINTIYRTRGTAFKAAYAWDDAFSFAALQQMYTLGTFDILTYHMTQSYMEELETLFAQRIMFYWNERSRELRLHNYVGNKERVLLNVTIERTEQDLLKDRETNMWIQSWAEAECREMLADIRGKYQSLPGPNGTTILNGQELLQQAADMKTQLLEELYDEGGMQDLIGTGMRAHFLLG